MSSPDLRSVQRWMSLVIRDPRGASAAVESREAAAMFAPAEVRRGAVVGDSDALSPVERVDIYNDGYFTRLEEAIIEDFPGVEHALGERRFRELVREYLIAHPSRHPNLIFASRHVPAFLSARDDLEHRGFIADLARLELARIEAFHAPASEPLDLADLQSLTPEEWAARRLAVDPTLRLLAFDYPVNAYLDAVLRGESPGIPGPLASWGAVYRERDAVRRTSYSGEQYETLRAIANGEPLGQALGHAGDEAGQVGDWFRDWGAAGLLVVGSQFATAATRATRGHARQPTHRAAPRPRS